MKRVYYALCAAGAAPVLGIYPAANAVAAGAHAPEQAVKKVPAYTCGANHFDGLFSAKGEFHAAVSWSGVNCIHHQYASLDFSRTGRTERVQYYSGAGKLLRTVYLNGTIYHSPSYTFWSSYPNFNAAKICQAIVPNSNHNKVYYGPLCEKV